LKSKPNPRGVPNGEADTRWESLKFGHRSVVIKNHTSRPILKESLHRYRVEPGIEPMSIKIYRVLVWLHGFATHLAPSIYISETVSEFGARRVPTTAFCPLTLRYQR
jgi:hypothetical protein